MSARRLVLVSMVLYGFACALPALGNPNLPPEATMRVMDGWQCLLFGLLYAPFVSPLVCWLPNPWLWTLWVRALRDLPTAGPWRWGATLQAGMTVAYLHFSGSYQILSGAGLWVGSIALAAESARRVEAR